MDIEATSVLQSIVPDFYNVVERICTPAWKINKAYYNMHNLILVYEGEAVFQCNGNEFKGTPGSLIYFKPGDLRMAYTFEKNPMKCFAVDFLHTCPILGKNGWELSSPVLPLHSIQKIQDPYFFSSLLELFRQLVRFWISGGNYKLIRCRAVFTEIIRFLLLLEDGRNLEYSKYHIVEKVMGFMTENYARRITLKMLADTVQISPSYLGSIFTEVTGKSPIKYLINMRMGKARELMRDGYTVTEVAKALGFNDVFYFSKCFKKSEGIAPSLAKEQDRGRQTV